MRSAETSGVGANGFGTTNFAVESKITSLSTITAPARPLFRNISSVSIAIALCALLAVAVFMIFDAARTFDEARVRLNLIGRSLASELSSMNTADAGASLLRDVPTYDPQLSAILRDSNGRVIAATDPGAPQPGTADGLASTTRATPLGSLTLQYKTGSLLTGVWLRGLAALAAAIALIALATRRSAETHREAGHDRLRDLIAAVPFGIACWSERGELLHCNAQYAARLSQGAEPKLNYSAAMKHLAKDGFLQVVSDTKAGRKLELHLDDGACLLIDERPLAESGFLTLITDVTERRRADVMLTAIQEDQKLLARRYHEEKLRAEAASRSKTSFLAHLSHDIRTPLNHIIGFADLIQHQTYGALGDPRYLDYVGTIKSSGESLLQSFAAILELAELEGGQKPLRREQFRVEDLVIATTRRFSAQAGRAGLTLAIGSLSRASLNADRFCLERMLGNLVDNAIRFTPSGGKVTLAAYSANDGVVLEVSDTGIGMSEDRLATVSQPFVFGDAAFTKEQSGLGLGIAIARAIAELSGGRIAIDSRPAMGTTVAISLPLAEAEAEKVVWAA
jgi:two-component system cell cycle sensor histidine kinase PleC